MGEHGVNCSGGCGMGDECPHGIHADMTCDPCEVAASQDAETCYALAVLGARYMNTMLDDTDAHDAALGAAQDALLTVTERDEESGLAVAWVYATPQIAATVARLTGEEAR